MAVTEASNSHYDSNVRDWMLIDRMLTGENVEQELVEGSYEASHTFQQRKKRADWRPHTRDLISRLTGELFTSAGEITRETPVSSDFLSTVGPENEAYEVQLINFAETLVSYHEAWVVMDPSQGLMVVEPQNVPRWNSEAVVVQGTRNPETSVFSDQAEQDVWTIYRSDGYEVWTPTDESEKQVDEGTYATEDWSFSAGPPALRFTLPWKVRFGLAVARSHRALYRLESMFDESLINSLGGLVQIATGGDDDLKQQIEGALKGDSLAIPYDNEHGQHLPLNIGVKGLGPGADALKRKRKELYRVAHQSLDQASKRMSATEADFRNRSGPAAALSVLAQTMESAEEDILDLVAEAEDRRNASRELDHDVDYPTDFSAAFDTGDEEIIRDIFGSLGMPVDVDTAVEVITQRLQSEGISVEKQIGEDGRTRRDAIRSKVEQSFARRQQEPTIGNESG